MNTNVSMGAVRKLIESLDNVVPSTFEGGTIGATIRSSRELLKRILKEMEQAEKEKGDVL